MPKFRTDLSFDDGEPAPGWYFEVGGTPVGPFDTEQDAEEGKLLQPAE